MEVVKKMIRLKEIRNLVEIGLIKNVFTISSEKLKLTRISVESIPYEIFRLVEHILDFHREYIRNFGLKYSFLTIKMKNRTLLILPISENEILFAEVGKDVPLYVVLAEILKPN